MRFSHVVCIYFEGINCLHTVTNTSQVLKDQNMKTHLNEIELECNLFRGPYQLKLCWGGGSVRGIQVQSLKGVEVNLFLDLFMQTWPPSSCR